MKRSLRCRRAFLPMPIAHAHAHASPIALHNTRAAAVWIIEKFVLAVNSISVEYGRSVEIICMTFLAVGHPTFCCRRNGIQLTYMNGDIWHWRGERSCVCVCVDISFCVQLLCNASYIVAKVKDNCGSHFGVSYTHVSYAYASPHVPIFVTLWPF